MKIPICRKAFTRRSGKIAWSVDYSQAIGKYSQFNFKTSHGRIPKYGLVLDPDFKLVSLKKATTKIDQRFND
jgi:hypothetical protein